MRPIFSSVRRCLSGVTTGCGTCSTTLPGEFRIQWGMFRGPRPSLSSSVCATSLPSPVTGPATCPASPGAGRGTLSSPSRPVVASSLMSWSRGLPHMCARPCGRPLRPAPPPRRRMATRVRLLNGSDVTARALAAVFCLLRGARRGLVIPSRRRGWRSWRLLCRRLRPWATLWGPLVYTNGCRRLPRWLSSALGEPLLFRPPSPLGVVLRCRPLPLRTLPPGRLRTLLGASGPSPGGSLCRTRSPPLAPRG